GIESGRSLRACVQCLRLRLRNCAQDRVIEGDRQPDNLIEVAGQGSTVAVIVLAHITSQGGALIDSDLGWISRMRQDDEGVKRGGGRSVVDGVRDRIGAPPVICRGYRAINVVKVASQSRGITRQAAERHVQSSKSTAEIANRN